jgi:hypothetical protein
VFQPPLALRPQLLRIALETQAQENLGQKRATLAAEGPLLMM